ncbi:MAG: carboxylesterase family protein, partial [Porticoccaceae bacterium]|nr:carboxylesterase family protein [Porticoccaceae bacterium]
PVGALRWRGPQPQENWQDQLPALTTTQPCIQPWTFLSAVPGNAGDVVGEEDCLYLNIWAPRLLSATKDGAERRLPVMLWIHGGGNIVGSSRFYTGQNIAANQQVIYVSLNYRLGALGWFTHNALRSTATSLEDASGNYGLLDIIAALQWIQTNIAVFGGDPANVTVFGESAGGRNVFGLLASPLAKGLFHKAISQSGSTRTETVASAENFADAPQPGWPNSSNELLAQLLINKDAASDRSEAKADLSTMTDETIAAILYQQTPDMLINAHMQLMKDPEMPQTPQLLRDGHVLPSQPMAELFSRTDGYNAVPMITGANRDEDKSFMASDPEFVDVRLGLLPSILDTERYERYADYYAERWHLFGVREMARLMRAANPEIGIYGYRFDWDESPSSWLADLPILVGAGHGVEISFMFNDFAGGLRLPFLYGEDSKPGREALSTAMMNYWGRFAHTGNPGKGLFQQQPEWTAWKDSGANIMVLDSPADGGWRMEHYNPTPEGLMQRIETDSKITSQKERCKLFVQSFLISYHSSDYWDPARYAKLAGGGCSNYHPSQFIDAF